MDHVDSKYVNLISVRLEKFKRVKTDLYNFRCPICGDSKKNKSKTRGYIYSVKSNTNFKCHNCGASMSLNNFIKKVDPAIHKQYSLEKFRDGHTGRNFVVDEPEFKFEKPMFKERVNLPPCSESKVASEYLQKRKLNPNHFYFSEDFSAFVKSFKEVEFDNLHKESRIVIPIHYQKKLVGFQGRALSPNSIKYITIMLNDDAPKIYGLDQIEKDESVYVTEGPFDSSFVCNAIAMCGADADVRRWGINNPV